MIRPGATLVVRSGASWERPPTTSADMRWIDSTTKVESVLLSGVWYTVTAGGLLAERSYLTCATGAVSYTPARSDLTGYTIDNATVACLFHWTAQDPSLPVYYFFGGLGTWPTGLNVAMKLNGANFDFIVYQGGSSTIMTTFTIASLTVGLHAFAVSARTSGGARWSFDGSAAASQAFAAAYTPPINPSRVAVMNDTAVGGAFLGPANGVCQFAGFQSDLSDASLAALATPNSTTARLAFSAVTGHPNILIDASRIEGLTTLVLPAYGLARTATSDDLTLNSAVRRILL